MVSAEDIALGAVRLVGGERSRQHGDKSANFRNVAALWNAWLEIRRDPAAPLDGHDVAQMMALMKKARTQTGAHNPDDYVDDVGYSAIAGQLAEPA